MGKPMLTVAEAARKLGVTPEAIRNAIWRDRLPAAWAVSPHGVRYRLIRPADLDAYAASRGDGRGRRKNPRKQG